MDPLVPYILSFSTNDIPNLLIIILCIVLGGFFAAAETAFSQCNRFKIAAKAEAGNKRAKLVEKIIDKFDNSIINILICINVTHIIASTLATILFLSMTKNEDLASLLSTIITTLLIFMFSEMLPKYIANTNSDRVALSVAIPMYVVGIILTPIALFFRLIVFLTKKIFRVNDKENEITEDDFQDTVEDKIDEGTLEEQEVEIIQNAVEFGDFTVMDVLTPLDKMVMFDCGKSVARRNVLNFLLSVPYTRIPVYEENKSNIIGILHIKKYLLAVKQNKNYFNFKTILTKPLFVASTTKIDDMVDIFQNKQTHIAIVQNDKKEILGMVTMEDVVEKLVGDIDEKNPPKVKIGGRK